MQMVATLWWPDLNPVGQWSIAAALVSAFIWFAVERRWFRNDRWNDWITAIAPFVPLALILGARLQVTGTELRLDHGESRRGYWDAESYIAVYILIAAALILSYKAVRLPGTHQKIFGPIALVMNLGISIIEFAMAADRSWRF